MQLSTNLVFAKIEEALSLFHHLAVQYKSYTILHHLKMRYSLLKRASNTCGLESKVALG